jgi:hypothetical protein
MASGVQMRKQDDDGDETPQLFTVLKEKERKAGEGEVFGSAHTYVLGGGGGENGKASGDEGDGGAESVISKVGGKKSKRKRGDDSDSDDESDAKKFKF